jgi:plasmid stabilization system protein ParE
MRFRRTEEARDDLRRIAARIAEHDINAAVRVVLDLEERMKLLTTMPHMGRSTSRKGIRELILDEYAIPYRVKDNSIEVLRVWHSKQRWWG